MCLKWEALLAEGERPRAFGSMVVWVVCSSGSSGGVTRQTDRQAGGGRTVVRLRLSWEGLAARARRLAQAQLASAGVFWAKDALGTSKRFGLTACGARAAGGGGRSHWRASAVFVLFGSAVSVAREGSRLAQADRSGDVVRAHAAVVAAAVAGVCGGR